MKATKTYNSFIISCLCFIFGVSHFGYSNSTPSSNFSIDFELVNGLIVVEATLNSKKGNYILDTGCSFLAIDGETSSSSMIMETTEFNISASEVKVENFEFGLIKEKSIDAVQFDMDKINQLVNRDIDGLIGTQIISDYNLMIDYNQNKVVFISDRSELSVFDPIDYAITRAPIDIKGNKSFIQMTIAGQEVSMLLDSGANISVLDQKWSDSLTEQHIQNDDSKMSDDFTIPQSTINNVSISDLGIVYRDLDSFQKETPFDGILSLNSLNADKVLFDYKRNQVIFFWTTDDVASVD